MNRLKVKRKKIIEEINGKLKTKIGKLQEELEKEKNNLLFKNNQLINQLEDKIKQIGDRLKRNNDFKHSCQKFKQYNIDILSMTQILEQLLKHRARLNLPTLDKEAIVSQKTKRVRFKTICVDISKNETDAKFIKDDTTIDDTTTDDTTTDDITIENLIEILTDLLWTESSNLVEKNNAHYYQPINQPLETLGKKGLLLFLSSK